MKSNPTVFTERFKLKRLLSAIICMIFFIIGNNDSRFLGFALFCIFFLIQFIIHRKIELNNDTIMLSIFGIRYKKIYKSEVRKIELNQYKTVWMKGVNYGILYLLLDISTEFIEITTDHKKIKIPTRYYNDDLFSLLKQEIEF